jgi:hypothetical protein
MIPLKEIVSFRAAVETGKSIRCLSCPDAHYNKYTILGKKHTKKLVAADLPTETIRGLIIYTSDHSV